MKFETDPRTIRKFLRDDAKSNGGEVGVDTPGKGSRYAIESKSVRSLQTRFNRWVAEKSAKSEGADEVAESDETDEPATDA